MAAKVEGVLGIDTENTKEVGDLGLAVFDGMTANVAKLPAPTVPLTTLTTELAELTTAQGAVGSRTRGLASIRDTKRNAVVTTLKSLLTYVNSVASLLSKDLATALIIGAGFKIASAILAVKKLLAASQAVAGGPITLRAFKKLLLAGRTGARTVHWRMMVAGGTTWTDLKSTGKVTTSLPAPAAGTNLCFQVMMTVGETDGQWSDTVPYQVR